MALLEPPTISVPASLKQFAAFESARTGSSESEIVSLALGLLAHLRLHTFDAESVVIRFDPNQRELRFETTVYARGIAEAALRDVDTVGEFELSTPFAHDDEPPMPPLRLV